MTIHNLLIKYYSKIDSLDLELLIARVINKPREFVLAHPEARVAPKHELRIKNHVNRRIYGEPLAYILGSKEFFGLDFKVDKNTLVPRPETELLVELAIQETRDKRQETSIIDIGTGSGNIIISLAKLLESRIMNKKLRFFGIDISSGALKIAKQNAKAHKVDKKIKFIKSNLLKSLIGNWDLEIGNSKIIILANLPYLSEKIYNNTAIGVKKYEPRSALLSANHGLAHYEKLLKQIKEHCHMSHVACHMEISPEQKPRLTKIIKKYFPQAKIDFHKDLAGKWRVCSIEL